MLRFTISFTHSYSSDELSAITRLKINGLSNILEFGVMTGDMHPAGVQLFEEFWSSIFGTSELTLRLPFVVMGVLSICLTYLLGKTYLNKKSGLIAAALLTVTYFPILHSELARPYSPGLLFSLLVAWFWFRVLLIQSSESNKLSENKWLNVIGLAVSFALAMYTHYFAFMFVGFIGLTGLFFLKKETLLPYLTAGALGILLFLPHLNITIYHLSIDGGLQWLARPDKTWLFQFIFHAFNESYTFLITIVGVVLIVLYKNKTITSINVTPNRKNVYIFGLWFFGIYVVAHIFSFISSPILKFPVMLFPLPFLFLLIGNIFSKLTDKYFNIVFSAIILIGVCSTIIEKDLYGNKHFGVFKELVEPISDWRKTYGEDNIHLYMNVSNPNYLNYYATQQSDSLIFDRDVMAFNEDISIRQELLNSDKDYCIVGYSARLTLPQIYETCKEFYPVILDYKKLNNCAVFLLARSGKTFKPKQQIIAEFKTTQNNSGWKFQKEKSYSNFYVSDSTNIYGPDYIFKKSDLTVDFDYYLKLIVEAESNSTNELTISLTAKRNGEPVTDKNGKDIWEGHDLETMINTSGSDERGYFALNIPKSIEPTDDIQISLWNRNGQPIKIKSIKILAVENLWN